MAGEYRMTNTTAASRSTRLGALAWAIILVAASGWVTNKALVATQADRIDSLEAANVLMQERLELYRDSLVFYEFIDSGEYDQAMRVKDGQINRLTYELAVCWDGGQTIATELVDDLFSPASANLTEAGRVRLALHADAVKVAAERGLVRIEGFADATKPVGDLQKRYPSNWELSAARAAAVLRYFVETHEVDDDRIAVVSYGASRPISSNSTASGRRLNRRIRITEVTNGG